MFQMFKGFFLKKLWLRYINSSVVKALLIMDPYSTSTGMSRN